MSYRFKLTLVFLVVVSVSCSDYLDREPKDLVTEDEVWSDPDAIEAYMVKLYDDMELEDFDYQTPSEAGFLPEVTDIAVRSFEWGDENNPTVPTGANGWWGYDEVRKVNVFLDKMEKEAEIEDEDLRKQYMAEGHFIRAYYYFSMVKRYGGVPIIEDVQEYKEDSIADLQVPRNTEQEVYDFIRDELQLAIDDLPESHGSSDDYRINKYGALALMSRAMLYAGSSADYAEVKLDGLVGIPKGEANKYYQYSLEASEEIMDSGQYSLYDQSDNKAENFQNLFLSTDGNSEVIFAKHYDAGDKGHSYDFYNAPQSFRVDYGNAINPSLSLVEDYEYEDGSSGELKIKDDNGDLKHFDSPFELFENKDPRLFATVLLPFADWQGDQVEIRRGILDEGEKITSAEDLDKTYGSGDEEMTVLGKDGPTTSWDPTKTGFYVKKSMNPTERVESGRSDQPWIVFRLGEIFLNHAEAAFKLGKDNKALQSINKIRDRAGIADLSSIDMDKIKHERKVELAFENHRFWDIRRWRTATDLLNNHQFKALYPWFNWETKDYTFTIEDAPKKPRTFLKKTYYEPIPADEIQKNPELEQNPDY